MFQNKNRKAIKKIRRFNKDKALKKEKIRKVRRLIFLILMLLFLIFIPRLVTLSRYKSEDINNFFTRTEKFYFLSDKLFKEGPEYKINNWSGVEPYNIIINMSSMNNLNQRSPYDIDYEIKVSSSDNIRYELSKTEGKISKNTSSDIFNVEVFPKTQLKDKEEATLNIEARSKTKYNKVLKGSFKFVVGKEEVTYSIKDRKTQNYMLINITNSKPYYIVKTRFGKYNIGDKLSIYEYNNLTDTDKEKVYSAEVKIEYDPNKYILDTTNQNYVKRIGDTKINIGGYNYINSITFNVAPLSSTSVRIYKKNPDEDNTYPKDNKKPVVNFSTLR